MNSYFLTFRRTIAITITIVRIPIPQLCELGPGFQNSFYVLQDRGIHQHYNVLLNFTILHQLIMHTFRICIDLTVGFYPSPREIPIKCRYICCTQQSIFLFVIRITISGFRESFWDRAWDYSWVVITSDFDCTRNNRQSTYKNMKPLGIRLKRFAFVTIDKVLPMHTRSSSRTNFKFRIILREFIISLSGLEKLK